MNRIYFKCVNDECGDCGHEWSAPCHTTNGSTYLNREGDDKCPSCGEEGMDYA